MENFIKIQELIQGSSDWLEWRRTVIGASDAPTIMRETPWKSRATLEREKAGEISRFKGNAATRLGHELEPIARERLSARLGKNLDPAVVQSVKWPWLAASLDGIDNQSTVVAEIKCGACAHRYTTQNGKVQPYYYGQLQHILLVTGLSQIIYFSFFPDTPECLIEIDRDENYIDKLLEETSQFKKQLLSRGHKLSDTLYSVDNGLKGIASRNSDRQSNEYRSSVQPTNILSHEILQGKPANIEYPANAEIHSVELLLKKTFENGTIFFGQHQSGTPHGFGGLLARDELRYLGSWSDDSKSGPGLYRDLDQKVHIGVFEKDSATGFGILIESPDEKYVGDLVDGQPNGFGSKIYLDGSRYSGQWQNGQPNGRGQLSFEFEDCEDVDDSKFKAGRFEGYFKDGKPHGKGRWWWWDEVCLMGEWINGEITGNARVVCFAEENDKDGANFTTLPSLLVQYPKGLCIKITGVETRKEFQDLKRAFQMLSTAKELWYKQRAWSTTLEEADSTQLLEKLDIAVAEWDRSCERFNNWIEDLFGRGSWEIKNLGLGEDYVLIDPTLKIAKTLRRELYAMYIRLIDQKQKA